MLDSFMLKSGGDELAMKVHSISASVTTVFLFTRIWARTTRPKGLWWDDYMLIGAWACQMVANALYAALPSHFGFRVVDGTAHGWTAYQTAVTFNYIAVSLSKTAFATTMLRLSDGRTKTILWCTIVVVCAWNAAAAIVSWLKICDVGVKFVGLSGGCVPLRTAIWIQIASAIFTTLADIVLTVIPWKITANVFLTTEEKLGVSVSMSLVGLAVPCCLAKAVIAGISPEAAEDGVIPDWTYGLVMITCLWQAEVAIYIIAQTLPLIRVLLQGDSKMSRNSGASSPTRNIPEKPAKASSKTNVSGTIEEVRTSIELVQLPTGRIVPADSEEGKALRATQAEIGMAGTVPSREGDPTPGAPSQRTRGATAEDEVHKMWSDMGLSKKAWSASPPASPEQVVGRGQQHLG